MAEQKHGAPPERVISVRKLVALDIVLHGSRLILTEFVVTVVLAIALGLWIISSTFPLSHAGSPFKLVAGIYFLCLAINYLPMLHYAIMISRRASARQEVAAELAEPGRFARRVGARQFLLVLPLVIPALAIVQERHPRS